MRILSLILYSIVLVTLAACSPSKTERDANERARLELEEKSQHEAEAANQAITHMNLKLGRKVAPLDLGLSPTTQSPAPPPQTPKP